MSSRKPGQKREWGSTTIASHVITRAQKKQKLHYDERVKPQILQPEDKVLVLVPARRNKLQLEWVGPYKITRQVTPVDYEVETPGRRKEKKIYHVNLLKKWHFPSNHNSMLVLVQESSQDEQEPEGNLEEHLLPLTDQPKEVATNRLAPSQQEDLRQLLSEFPDVAGEGLGRTAAIQHEVRVMDSEPIRQQPYRVPVSRKEGEKGN